MTRCLDSLEDCSRRALGAAFAHARALHCAPFAVDCTVGNGYDTLFLAMSVAPEGRVWAFDVQEAGLACARNRLAEYGAAPCGCSPDDLVSFIHAGHEILADRLPPESFGALWGATFNLGYLPGSDKTVITRAETTLAALEALAPRMHCGGVISVHGYAGHGGGREEVEAVGGWMRNLLWDTWRVAEYAFANKKHNREVLFLAERL